jgi:hypothetical protein
MLRSDVVRLTNKPAALDRKNPQEETDGPYFQTAQRHPTINKSQTM